MKRFVTYAVASALGAVLCGCTIFGGKYEATRVFDLRTDKVQMLPDNVEMQVGFITNMSGSGRKFSYLAKDGEFRTDPYRSWLLNPDATLHREFGAAFQNASIGKNRDRIHLSGILYRFHFDEEGVISMLDVECKLTLQRRKAGAQSVVFRRKFESKAADNSGAAQTAAMKNCIDQAVDEIGKAAKLLISNQ